MNEYLEEASKAVLHLSDGRMDFHQQVQAHGIDEASEKRDRNSGFVLEVPGPGEKRSNLSNYRGVSVNSNTATETQTLNNSQEGGKAGRGPKEHDQKSQPPKETQGPCP